METNGVDERAHFVRDFESGHWSMTERCERYGGRPDAPLERALVNQSRSAMRIRSIHEAERRATEDHAARVEVTRVPPRSLSEREAAEYIGMSPAWLKKSRTQKLRGVADAPPFVHCGTRRVVYRREDLDNWQRRHLEQVGPPSTVPQGI